MGGDILEQTALNEVPPPNSSSEFRKSHGRSDEKSVRASGDVGVGKN